MEYFWNRIYYHTRVFFQFRWFVSFFLRFETLRRFFLNGHTVKERKDGGLDTSKFYALKKYDPWFESFFLFFMEMGVFPIGLCVTKDIPSFPRSLIIALIITCGPIYYIHYRLLSRNDKCEKYYDQFEHDSPQQRRKWQIVTAITMLVVVIVFALNWVFFTKM